MEAKRHESGVESTTEEFFGPTLNTEQTKEDHNPPHVPPQNSSTATSTEGDDQDLTS